MNDSHLRTVEEVQQLTQEYASYSQSKNGLGNVLGGIAGLTIVLVNWLIGPGLLTALLTIGLTICWLIGKEVIRSWLYRPFGKAQEVWEPRARTWHTWSVAFVILVALAVWVFFIATGGIAKPQGWLYLLFVAIMPWVAWRYLRTPNEFIVGVFLLCACAVTSAGGVYGLAGLWWVEGLIPGLIALIMLYIGIMEHRRFRKLAAQFQAQRTVEE